MCYYGNCENVTNPSPNPCCMRNTLLLLTSPFVKSRTESFEPRLKATIGAPTGAAAFAPLSVTEYFIKQAAEWCDVSQVTPGVCWGHFLSSSSPKSIWELDRDTWSRRAVRSEVPRAAPCLPLHVSEGWHKSCSYTAMSLVVTAYRSLGFCSYIFLFYIPYMLAQK